LRSLHQEALIRLCSRALYSSFPERHGVLRRF